MARKRPASSLEAEPEQGLASVKAEPASPAPAKRAKDSKPEKGKETDKLPAPSKKAWQDARYQMLELQKKGKGSLKKAFEVCKSQEQKREFYYNVFLLSPDVAKKEVHKESLQKAATVSGSEEGWLTKWDVAKKEGVHESHPDFDALANDAVKGLQERDHENPLWAAKGIKQYYYYGNLMTQKVHTNESLTKAKQTVDDLDDDHFSKVESALRVDQPQQLTVGRKVPKPLPAPPPEPEQGTDLGLEFKKAYQGLKKAFSSLSSGLDKLQMFRASLCKAEKNQLLVPPNVLQSVQKTIEEWTDEKEKWMDKVMNQHSSMPEVEPEEGATLIQKMEEDKKGTEDYMKAANKKVGPSKLWARNEGISS